MAVVLTIDFEAYRFDDDSWLAFSVGICTYPMGCILDSLTRILKIPLDMFDQPRKHFWQIMHPESYAYLQRQGEDAANREVYEKELVQFVRDAHRKYENLSIISDNPTFDVTLLDTILTKHGAPKSCFRHDSTWTHIVDTRTYQDAIQDCFQTKNLTAIHRKAFGRNRLIVRQVDNIPHEHAIVHTPFYDCMKVASSYFIALDLAKIRY